MKLKLLTLLMGVVGLGVNVFGQTSFTFSNQLKDTAQLEIDQSLVSRHFLGEFIAVKYYRVQKTYTYVQVGSVTSPGEHTIITKPIIYNSLKKLNTHYKKQLKKGEIDSVGARKELGWCFDVGFSIFDQNTSDFEAALKAARSSGEIAQLFAQVILK